MYTVLTLTGKFDALLYPHSWHMVQKVTRNLEYQVRKTVSKRGCRPTIKILKIETTEIITDSFLKWDRLVFQ